MVMLKSAVYFGMTGFTEPLVGTMQYVRKITE